MADELAASNESDMEEVVNRWLFDFYSSLVMKFFGDENHEDFLGARNVLDSILARPMECAHDMSLKVRLVQFISRINMGDKLDTEFDDDNGMSPLESALSLLEQTIEEFELDKEDFLSLQISLKEMIVGMFIMQNNFEEAKVALDKYLPEDMGGKRDVFEELIAQKSQTHELFNQMNFRDFKGDVLAVCHKLCKFNNSFLSKAAKKLVNTRLLETNVQETSEELSEPSPLTHPQKISDQQKPCENVHIHKLELAMAHKALMVRVDEKKFIQLQQEIDTEVCEMGNPSSQPSISHSSGDHMNSQQAVRFQKHSSSNVAVIASPKRQPHQMDAGSSADSDSQVPFTVARLVVEPDSQTVAHCSQGTTEAQGVETEKDTDTESSVADREVSTPVRKLPQRASKSKSTPDSSRRTSVESEANSQTFAAPRSPMQRHNPSLDCASSDQTDTTDDMHITDSSSENLTTLFPDRPASPRNCSTPQKSTFGQDGILSRYKSMLKNATESKETWPEEDSLFPSKKTKGSDKSDLSSPSNRKRRWTDKENKMLIEGVKKFGEGNWSRIKSYYSFDNRTNVNLKDRWRNMQKKKLV